MLGMYLGSVVIYMLIMSALAMIFGDAVRNNGWLDEPRKNKHSKLAVLFYMSAVPFIRLAIVVLMVVMAIYPKEKVMAWIEEHKNLNS